MGGHIRMPREGKGGYEEEDFSLIKAGRMVDWIMCSNQEEEVGA
jgi:hypothetical protein